MGLRERAETADRELRDMPRLHRIKHALDRVLPVILVLILVYLYLEFFAVNTHVLYPYRYPLQILILTYFISELLVDLMIYEQGTAFLRDRWLDILLTIPFFTAFKGVNSVLKALKLVKPAKTAKAGNVAKTGRLLKAKEGVKIVQKLGKLVKKGKKSVTKRLKR